MTCSPSNRYIYLDAPLPERKLTRRVVHIASANANPLNLSVTGISHDTAPVHLREQLSLPDDRLYSALGAAGQERQGCVILSTCNRFEIYLTTSERGAIQTLLSEMFGPRIAEVEPCTYRYDGAEAARHLFRVAAGVDSLVLGEVQILGQVQRAWQSAHQAEVAGAILSQLFHRAVTVGKRAHSETSISRHPASVSYAAVVLARQIFGSQLGARRVLVIGTGEVGEGVARCLYEHGLSATVVAHRHIEKAQALAERYQAEVATWDELPRCLAAANIVITSTSAPHTILERRQIEEAMRARPDEPLYLIDLAVPRDIDPSAESIPGVHINNIDDLQAVVRSTLVERQGALPQIEAIIEAEVVSFTQWLKTRTTFPTIRRLHEQASKVTEMELRWALAKLPDLTPRERQIVEALAARITGKLLHGPIEWLKAQAAEQVEPEYDIEAVGKSQLARLFYTKEETYSEGTDKDAE
ncbi:MAG: glutamyl-tRNA reductase [Chloroflexi bacterium]|nr:glutamyl-tRNA reductase [Chloroflexota bacterium]